MAGGKETPRQKMIGMMYLVLTALLALNVSKSILDAFVAIEENTQKANIAQFERGNSYKDDVREELTTTPANAENNAKIAKLKIVLAKMEETDKLTAALIKQIDDIKVEILKESGEMVDAYKENDEETIMWKKYDAKNTPCLPIRMHLMAVQAKDQYDVPMHHIIGEDIKNPTGTGKKLWEDFVKYRRQLVEAVGSYKLGENAFKFKATDINEYKDNKDLIAKVEKMMKSNEKSANLKDDAEMISNIYIALTKLERNKVHDMDGVHWVGMTFDHSPLVAAVASLSSMQQDILSARALAMAHWKSKVSTGEYSFNKIMPLAYGPLIANNGDEVQLQVMMAAYDTDNQPSVTSNAGSIEIGNGQGIIKAKVSGSGDMVLKGTVAIKNKSGVEKRENWEHKIKIMKPEGTVSLPDMNVLYRGYENKVEGVASGYDQTVLTGSNVSLTKVAKGYIGKPGSGKIASITISGKNSIENKTVRLGQFDFRVMNLPPAQVYFGSAANGAQGSKFETRLFTKYPPEIPLNVTFTTLSWEMEFLGRKAAGNGSQLDGAAISLLKQAKPGNTVSFIVKYRGPDNLQRQGVCVVKL